MSACFYENSSCVLGPTSAHDICAFSLRLSSLWGGFTRRDSIYGLSPGLCRSGSCYNGLRAPGDACSSGREPGCGPSRKERGFPARRTRSQKVGSGDLRTGLWTRQKVDV